MFYKEVRMATREIVKARLQQQHHNRQEAQAVVNNDRNSYSAARAIPYRSVPQHRQSHHQYRDQQQLIGPSGVEEPNNYVNDSNDQGRGSSRNNYDDSNDFDERQELDHHRGDDSNDQGDDSNDQGDDSNDQVDDSNDSDERHQVHADQRAGRPPKIISRFWFEDANGKFVGGNNKRKIKPDLKVPQTKRVRFSLDNNEVAAAPGSSSSSAGMEVSIFGHNSRKQAQLPRTWPSDRNNQEVYRSIKEIEMIEYRRRMWIVNHLTKICKAIPLTVKMVNPLKNFNGYQ